MRIIHKRSFTDHAVTLHNSHVMSCLGPGYLYLDLLEIHGYVFVNVHSDIIGAKTSYNCEKECVMTGIVAIDELP